MSSLEDDDTSSFYPYTAFKAFLEAPSYHIVLEGVLLLWILWLLFRKSYTPAPTDLSEREKEQLIQEWTPEPLVPPTESEKNHYALNPRIVTSKMGKRVIVDGKECLNLATHNYLGLVEHKLLEERAVTSLRKYGVGSCGPRGFYGTVDIHLELENRLAKFMNVEEAVLYSYGFSAVASAIPAYAKSNDVIFADEGVHFAIQKGLSASRSKIVFFKHNDVKDLNRVLLEQEAEDKKNPRKAKVTRRFLVVEGLYMNHGDICPLPEIMVLKKKFKVRIFLDESVSFGVLGRTGRGITEYYNIPVEDIDHLSSTLENAVSAYGGFCCGTTFIVDHQRLSGLGYCFSASLPPLQAACAIASLDILESNPSILEELKDKCILMHDLLSKYKDIIEVEGISFSPVKHLRFLKRHQKRSKETMRLENVVSEAWKEGIALTVSRYLEDQEFFPPEPSIRLTVSVSLTKDEILSAVDVVVDAFKAHL